jgi:hypothetical protein
VEGRGAAETVNGSVIPLDNGTAGQTRFGRLDNFRRASGSAAAEIAADASPLPHGIFRQHLGDTYNVPQAAIADLINGLTPGEDPAAPACNRQQLTGGSCCPTAAQSCTRASTTSSAPFPS